MFVSPVWVFIGRALLPLHQRVGRLLGEPRLLQLLVHVLVLHLGLVCPNFGDYGVLALVVFDGHGVAAMLLDGVLDLVELLAHVVGRVVLGGRRSRRVAMGALFPATADAPEEGRGQSEDPDDDEDGAEQGDQVVWRRDKSIQYWIKYINSALDKTDQFSII